VVINQDFFGSYLGPILRYMTTAERGWHRAITQLRTVQNDRRRNEQLRETATPQPQPTEPEKVMAIGSVSQNDPEPEELQAVAGASHPITLTSELPTERPQEPQTIAAASQPVTPASELTTDHWPLTTDRTIEKTPLPEDPEN
jgi:hypothetical protein